MIFLSPNEKIVKAFEVKASGHGRGTLYITSLGVAFESLKYGSVLDVSFEWIRSYVAPKNNRFELVWDTPLRERFRYSFKLESGEHAVNAYAAANKQYAVSISEIVSLKTKMERGNSETNGTACNLPA
jgi:hypothetical protein